MKSFLSPMDVLCIFGIVLIICFLIGGSIIVGSKSLHSNLNVEKQETSIQVVYEDNNQIILFFNQNEGQPFKELKKYIETNNYSIQSTSFSRNFYTITINKKL